MLSPMENNKMEWGILDRGWQLAKSCPLKFLLEHSHGHSLHFVYCCFELSTWNGDRLAHKV